MIPKFRAWHKKEKKMGNVMMMTLFHDRILNRDQTTLVDLRKYNDYTPRTWKFKDIILMQSTGLKDKNGKEIFEGDIFICGKTSNGKSILYKVYWKTESACFAWEQITPCLTFEFDVTKEAEVIGNIHENPKLLEGGNKNG